MSNPVGRPSKYKGEETLKKCEEYLDFGYFQTAYKEVVTKDGIQQISYERPNSIPSVVGLALHLEIRRETVYDWAKKFEEFSNILDKLQKKQEDFLFYHGLTKGYDSGFAKFIAQNVTNLRDKIETVNTNSNINIDVQDQDL